MPQQSSPARRAFDWRIRLLAAALLCGLSAVVPAAPPGPTAFEVSIAHSRPVDHACSAIRRYPIAPAWQEELDGRLPAFQEVWQLEGRPALERMFELTGGRLHGTYRVRLTLCDLPSSSLFGTSVNMRHALRAFTDAPVSLRYKVAVMNHELLHRLLGDVDLKGSRMLALHASEPARVRRHLHLFALTKAALIDLRHEGTLRELVGIDSSLPANDSRRAWQIINERPDTYIAYVNELRQAHRAAAITLEERSSR